MREILFRGKADASINKWIYGGYYNEAFKDFGKTYHFIATYDGVRVDGSTVGQYTGVNDCEGNKIFEGDIVRLIDNDDYTDCYIVKYFGDKGYPAFDIDGWDNSECNGLSECTACFKLQIIGNIYDNPELVEVEK